MLMEPIIADKIMDGSNGDVAVDQYNRYLVCISKLSEIKIIKIVNDD